MGLQLAALASPSGAGVGRASQLPGADGADKGQQGRGHGLRGCVAAWLRGCVAAWLRSTLVTRDHPKSGEAWLCHVS